MNHKGYKDPTADCAIRNVAREEKRGRRRKTVSYSFGKCRSCGAQVLWIRTAAGKNMPCNPAFVPYRLPREGEKGEEKLVLSTGEVVSAIETAANEAEGNGYISHFATCPNANSHRKR